MNSGSVLTCTVATRHSTSDKSALESVFILLKTFLVLLALFQDGSSFAYYLFIYLFSIFCCLSEICYGALCHVF